MSWSAGAALARGNALCVVLDTEWEGLCRLTSTRRRFRDWQHHAGIPTSVTSVAGLVAAIRHGGLDRSVALSWVLLDLAEAGDELAVRTLIQVIVPALVGELSGWLSDVYRPGRGQVLTADEVDQLVVAEAAQAVAA